MHQGALNVMLRSTHSRDLRDATFLGKSDLHVVAAVEDGEAHSSATSGFCKSGARQAIPAAAASAGADSGAQAATERGVHTGVTAASTNLSAHDDESRAPARDELEDSAIGCALLATPTSNSWSMLDAVAAKVSVTLGATTTTQAGMPRHAAPTGRLV